jgi:23S rRNA pseudouridine1911/1915/1917 synthase
MNTAQNQPSDASGTPNFDPNYPPYIEHTYTFDVPAKQTPMRLDVFLTEYIANATRSKVQTAIDEGNVSVNGAVTHKSSRKVLPFDHIECRVMKPPPLALVPEPIPLNICYEDDAVLVVNKPAGMVTHPGFGNRYGTLVNAVLYHLGQREAIPIEEEFAETSDEEEGVESASNLHSDNDNDNDDEESTPFRIPEGVLYAHDVVRPGIVHRLDKDTSGILVISKEVSSHAKLAKQFADRTAKRQYYALVWGNVKEDVGIIEENIGRSPRDRKIFTVVRQGGKYACTEYTVLERFAACTLLALKLRTGRTHQIRVHCSHLHHPLLGDEAYGGAQPQVGGNSSSLRHHALKLLTLMPRQALHARTLGFTHPTSSAWLEFESELPEDFQQTLEAARDFTKQQYS